MHLVISTVLFKLKDFSKLQAVVNTVKVVISWKRCDIETLLLQTLNRKRYVAYKIAAIPMTLSDHQCHSLIASLFKWDFSYSCAAFDKISTDVHVVQSLCDSLAFC